MTSPLNKQAVKLEEVATALLSAGWALYEAAGSGGSIRLAMAMHEWRRVATPLAPEPPASPECPTCRGCGEVVSAGALHPSRESPRVGPSCAGRGHL